MASLYTVGELARRSGVTVRTLHHYDDIGLLVPSVRNAAGYRHYGDDDVQRLHRILAYRELGFSLEQIAALLTDCGDLAEHLRRQRGLLRERISRLEEMVANVERNLEAHVSGMNLSPEEIFEVFGDVDPTEFAEEAEQRWGDTEAYRESRRRTANYGKDDWLQIKAEGDEINARFAALKSAGVPAASSEATAAAEDHRCHIDRWFYPVPYAMHRGLAQLYVADARFAATYDELAPGLAQYVHDAILANADAREGAA